MPLVHDRSRPRLVPFNRRAAIRVPADDLRWLQRARLAEGPPVTLIDLSLRGALFEGPCRVRPGDRAEIELVAGSERTVSASHVVRCELVEIHPQGVRYRSACMFTSPLPWDGRLPASLPVDPQLNLDEGEYQPRGGWSEVMVHLRYGNRQLHGYTHDFQPAQGRIDVWPSRTSSPAAGQAVPLALVRTVQVLRDLDDDGPLGSGRAGARGMPVEVAFKTNQLTRALMPAYDADAIGFWLLPLHPGDVTRAFAVAAAVAEIRLLYPA